MTLARAVHVAHEAGIIHRDLKPANVLYASDGVPKITDFGLAKRLDSRRRPDPEPARSWARPATWPPSRPRGHSRNVGPAADVYALGAILYEMLTGRPPFKGETPMETIRQVIDDDPVPPSRLVAARPARPGDDLPEVPAQGAGPALRDRPGPGGRPEAIPRRRADRGSADPRLGARGQVGPATARGRLRRYPRPPGPGPGRRRTLAPAGSLGRSGASRSPPPSTTARAWNARPMPPGYRPNWRAVQLRISAFLPQARGFEGRRAGQCPSRPTRVENG